MSKPVVRPHIEKLRPELEALVRSAWNDPKVLAEVEFELTFRHKKPSIELREKISKRINELRNEPNNEDVVLTTPSSRDLLELLGYRTSDFGVSKDVRREILSFVFTQPLSKTQPDSELRLWGEPQTAVRLKKIAETLSEYIRTSKRNLDGKSRMVEWSDDLEFLKREYYCPELGFTWPRP